jgi:hypothetical protein
MHIHKGERIDTAHAPIFITIKKLKLPHHTPRRGLGVRRYSSYLFSTSALDGDELPASRPGRALTPGKGQPVPIVQEFVTIIVR